MGMRYSDAECHCKICGMPVLRYKICEQCIIDMLYDAWISGAEPTKNTKTLAYRRGIKPLEIKKAAMEDLKGRI